MGGDHRHTRTEELYFVISGCGEMMLDGVHHEVRAGDVILTGIGTKHGLLNTGDEYLSWLVIEMCGPATAEVLHGAMG